MEFNSQKFSPYFGKTTYYAFIFPVFILILKIDSKNGFISIHL